MQKVVLSQALAQVSEHWRPLVVAALNGQEVKLARFLGTFPWHHHEDADEFFLGLEGRFRVEFRDRVVELGPGEFLVVPRGVEHRTAADTEAAVLLFEPAGVRNTGNIVDAKYTAPDAPAPESA
jgi:mannose-6-phosphate isomerase-like protein (cupin superfamily)